MYLSSFRFYVIVDVDDFIIEVLNHFVPDRPPLEHHSCCTYYEEE